MLDMMKEKFKKMGYEVKLSSDKFEIFEKDAQGHVIPSPSLWCDSQCAYSTGERNQTVVAFGLKSLENNVMGLYFFITKNSAFVENELLDISKEIFAGASSERIKEAFLQYLGQDFIINRINYNPNEEKDNAFNYTQNGDLHIFNYNAKDKFINISASKNINFAYRGLLLAACLRKQYEEILSKEFQGLKLDDELDLSLFSLFYSKSYSIIETKEKIPTLWTEENTSGN